jgi:hypothetical protein
MVWVWWLLVLLLIPIPTGAQPQPVRLFSAADGPDDITANAATGASLATGGFGTVGFQVTNTFVGTIELQCTVDGTTYRPLTLTPSNSATTVTSVTGTGIWFASAGGCITTRARSTAWTSGTATTTIVGISAGGSGGSSGGGGGGLTDAELRASAVPVSLATVPSHAVTNAGTFVVQENGAALTALQLIDNIVSGTGVNVSQMNGVAVLMGSGVNGTGAQRISLATDDVTALNIIDIEALLTTGNTQTDGIEASLTTMTGAIASNRYNVDIKAVNGLVPTDDLTFDFDSGAGTQTRSAIGIAFSASGGAVLAVGGTGTASTATLRTVTASDDLGIVSLGLLDDAVFTDDAAFTPATSKAFAVGFQADDTTPDSVDEGDFGVPRMSLDRMLYMRPGGASVFYRTSAGTTEDEHEIKATAGTLYSVLVTNTNAAARYIRCYNLTAASTTPGTSTVFWGAAIPGQTAGAGFAYPFPSGLTFDIALTCAFTTGAADTNTDEVAANEIKATYSFRD